MERANVSIDESLLPSGALEEYDKVGSDNRSNEKYGNKLELTNEKTPTRYVQNNHSEDQIVEYYQILIRG